MNKSKIIQIGANMKLFVIFLFSVLITAKSFSQQLELFDGNGVPTVEATAPEKFDPSFLRKLRAEIQAEQMKEHKSNEKLGWYKSVNKRFIPESATFAIAGGGVYFLTLMAKTNSDPAMMVKHIESLRDPIAHLSFYSFMAANGLYINFKTKGMDPMTKQLAMKTLQYKGMAAGSLASSITADVMSVFTECTKGWINNKNDEQSYAACDEVLKTWTLRNKFTQYVPQILSLVVSQYASDAVAWGKGALTQNKLSVSALQKTEAGAIKLFKISAATIDIGLTMGGGIVVKSIGWLGKLTTFGTFLAVDHMLTPSIMRVGNNLLQPFFFQFDVNKLDQMMVRASQSGWSSETAQKNKNSCKGRVQVCTFFNELPKEIENLTYRMQQWRLHQNSKVEADIEGWISESTKLLHQIDFSKNFYRSYLENLYNTLQRADQVKKGEFTDEPQRAWSTKTIYPYRTLPLYGVKTGLDFKGEKESDLYLRKPWQLQEAQHKYLIAVSDQFLNNIMSFNLDKYSEKKFYDILIGLKSDSVELQAKYLLQIVYPMQMLNPELNNAGEALGPEFTSALHKLKTAIGNPNPVMEQGAGFSQAYISNSTNLSSSEAAKFSMDTGIYRFNKATDLLFYNMICGQPNAHIDESVFSGLNFMPAKLITTKSDQLNLCGRNNGTVSTDNLYKFKIPSGSKNMSATEFLVSNLNQNLIGDITDSDGGSNFNQWWAQNTLPVVQSKFKNLDSRYQTLVTQAYGNILDQRGFLDFTLDLYSNWSKRLGGGMLDNMNFELEFYMSTLDIILNQKKISTENYVDSIISVSKLDKTNASTPAVLKIRQVYKKMFALFANSTTVDFKKIEDLNAELRESTDGIFKKLEELEKNPSLPAEIKSLISIKKGLQALEMDTKRYIYLKVNLANRLEIDASEMNDYLRAQKSNKIYTGTRMNGN
jgi:hypothetical protein